MSRPGLTVGMRVQTHLGLGTVLGFESFDGRGRSLPLSTEDTGGRVACELDDPSQWSLSATGVFPYFYRSQMGGVKL